MRHDLRHLQRLVSQLLELLRDLLVVRRRPSLAHLPLRFQRNPRRHSSSRLSLKYHPDKNKEKGAQQKFEEINNGV